MLLGSKEAQSTLSRRLLFDAKLAGCYERLTVWSPFRFTFLIRESSVLFYMERQPYKSL